MKACFPGERAAQIYSYALIMCANGFVHIDQIDDFYQESFLSVMYRNYAFKMGYTALTNLLHDLGLRGNPVKAFEQSLINNSSKNIAIDGHVIRSCSGENDLAEPGYKMNLLKASQVNLLIAYDIKNKIPLMYRTYRGSSVDKSSVLEFLRSRSFTDTKFIVDRGFYSDSVLSLMSENRNCYIIPVPSNNKHFRRIKKNAYTIVKSNAVNALDDAERMIATEDVKPDVVFFDMPGTLRSNGVIKTLSQMDYIFTPLSADRFVVESTLKFVTMFRDRLMTTGQAKTKGLHLFWTMVDGRERNDLYGIYEEVIAEMGFPVLSTRLPDSKKFRRDLSEERKSVFRSTIFPMDTALLKGSGIREFSEEISDIIRPQ